MKTRRWLLPFFSWLYELYGRQDEGKTGQDVLKETDLSVNRTEEVIRMSEVYATVPL
jgi:hypothetical protein